MFTKLTAKKRTIGIMLLVIMVSLFFAFNRFPKVGIVGEDLDAVTSPGLQCFQGFCIERDPGQSFVDKWVSFSVTYLRLVTVGMTFAFLVAGLAESFLFPNGAGRTFQSGGLFRRTISGAAVGPVMNLCSACIVPVSSAFRKRANLEGAIAMVQGSATMNIPALAMVFFVFTPLLGFSRLILAVVGALIIGPIVVFSIRNQRGKEADIPVTIAAEPEEPGTWKQAFHEGGRAWAKSSIGYFIRMSPIMIVAGFISGLAIQWLSPETVATYLGNDLRGVLVATTFGILINVPLLFEIPLVALLLLMGMGTAPAATLLFAAAAGGPITFWGLRDIMPKRALATFAGATWAVGAVGGIVVLVGGSFLWGDASLSGRIKTSKNYQTVEELFAESDGSSGGAFTLPGVHDGIPAADEFSPFKNIAPSIGPDALIENRYPGVAIFDYDRDGDMDIYVTSAEIGATIQVVRGDTNRLFRNNGDGTYTDVALQANAAIPAQNSSAVAACDFNNDGYQDLYVGGHGRIGDGLDYRSITDNPQMGAVVIDRLLFNKKDGTFEDVTFDAFGSSGNIRSAMSVSCGDVDGDGYLDIFVGNRADQDFVRFDDARHHGNFNVFYKNNGDGTFTDFTVEAGLVSPQVAMFDSQGRPITFPGPNGDPIMAFDMTLTDANGRIAGDPAGQTWATMFFDYDNDGDPDLWIADDGDRLKLYRNDSADGQISFTPVEEQMLIGISGQWMGFALGDYDGDGNQDVFVTNMGFHRFAAPQPVPPGGDCAYSSQLEWGTCYHMLLSNNGFGAFVDVSGLVPVTPSTTVPPESLDPSYLADGWPQPKGLQAYEFGFGTVFFDMENDGDEDLYWNGSLAARGEGPNGQLAPAFGRMLQNTGSGFKDVTVEARLLNVLGVDYSMLDPNNSKFDAIRQRISVDFHENGKGVAVGDLNGDGYLDLITTNSNGESFDENGERMIVSGPLFIWINSGGDNHWIKLRLKGRQAIDRTGSNADAIGARVKITSTGFDGQSHVQVREVLGSSSFLSMSSLDLNFGVGGAESIDSIEIRWPSGRVQTLDGLAIDQLHEITEPPQ
jgi:uncharacterized membrane protein YraQ (UPF0718 family)